MNHQAKKECFKTSVGGQALMEGIMMRGPRLICCAVRRPDGEIETKTDPVPVRKGWMKIPILRGAVSMVEEGAVFRRPRMVHLGAEYSRRFARGFSIGVEVDVYQHLSADWRDASGAWSSAGSATSFSAGVYMRVNPSFLLRRF